MTINKGIIIIIIISSSSSSSSSSIVNIFLYIYCKLCPRRVRCLRCTLYYFIFLEADLMNCKFCPRCIRYPRFT